MSGRDDLSGETQVSTKVFNSLGSKVAVRMLPTVGETDETTRLKGLHERKNLEVGSSLEVGVGGADGVLLNDEDSLAEKVGEDGDAVSLGDEHVVFLDGDCKEDMIERPGRIISKQNTKSLCSLAALVKSERHGRHHPSSLPAAA